MPSKAATREITTVGAAPAGVVGQSARGRALFSGLTGRVIDTLGAAIVNATTLEVKTYVSSDVGQAVTDSGGLAATAHARLRAFTRIGLDGDTEVCIPLNDTGDIDELLWTIHIGLVESAQAHRSDIVQMILSVAGR